MSHNTQSPQRDTVMGEKTHSEVSQTHETMFNEVPVAQTTHGPVSVEVQQRTGQRVASTESKSSSSYIGRFANMLYPNANTEQRSQDADFVALQKDYHQLETQNARLIRSCQTLHHNFDYAKAVNGDLQHENNELKQTNHDLAKQTQQEIAESQSLQNEILQLKKEIANSSHVGMQITDQEIQRSLESLYFGVQSWAVTTATRSKLAFRESKSRNAKTLARWVPEYQKRASAFRVKTCVAIVFMTLLDAFKYRFYFGYANDGPIKKANALAQAMQGDCSHKDAAQWRVMTYKMLTQTMGDSMQRAKTELLKAIINDISRILVSTSTIIWTDKIAESLEKTIGAGLDTIQALHFQQDKFRLEVPDLSTPGSAYKFMPAYMEDITAEDEDQLVHRNIDALLFPLVSKSDGSVNESPITVICRSKVVPATVEE